MYQLTREPGNRPMYAQIADEIERDLEQGNYGTGDFLPSEITLAKDLGVSRTTITKAYEVLVTRKLVRRIQGTGTQIAQAPMERLIIELTGFSQHVRQLGREPGSKLLRIFSGVGGGKSDVEAAYEEPIPLLIAERLRLAGGTPKGIQLVAIPQSLAAKAGVNETSMSANDASLYALLTAAGVVLTSAEESIVATASTTSECELMGIPKHTPVFEVFRKSFDQNGQMIEAVKARYLGNSYVYKVRLGTRQGLSQQKTLEDQ
jgi:GntR family transcriptional regulator